MEALIISCTRLRITILILIGIWITSTSASGFNVLIVSGFASRSHRHVHDEVAEALAKRGNNVTFITTVKEIRPIAGVTSKYLAEASAIMNSLEYNFFQGDVDDPEFFERSMQIVFGICEASLRDPAYQELLRAPRGTSKFDVIVIDAIFNECALVLSHHLEIPSVYISPSILLPGQAWRLNVPYPLSYLTTGFGLKQFDMNLMDRALNVLAFFGFKHHLESDYFPKLGQLIQKFAPGTPPIVDLERNVSMLMTNTHIAVNPSAPTMPYSMEVGCLNCNKAKKLPKDLDDFLTSSGTHGAIYFSLGSYTRGNDMPLEMRDKIVEAFSKIPQKILWKYEAEIKNLPSNVKLVKWAPQQDILAHPNLRLFITHGGGLSLLEAAYHGIPLLGFPLVSDQLGNIAYATYRGFAEAIQWKNFESEDLLQLIQRMIADPKYKAQAIRASAVIRDNAVDPKVKAAYHIEYVARHKGAQHLRSGADKLNIFQYFLLDVIGVALLVLVVVLLALFLLIRTLIRCFRSGGRSVNTKKYQ